MERPRNSIPWNGIILILLGIILLLSHTKVINIHFSQILWSFLIVYGFISTIRGYRLNHNSKIFWGTVIFLFGMYFLINTFDLVETYHGQFVAVLFLIFGFAFLTIYMNNFREVISLIVGILLFTAGIFLMFENYGYLDWMDVRTLIRTYWPVILILIGLRLLLKKSNKNQ